MKDISIFTQEDFYDFIEIRKANIIPGESNCIGTTLYLSGENDYDVSTSVKGEQIIQLNRSLFPKKGYIVAWVREYGDSKFPYLEFYHTGIIDVVEGENILISHRDAKKGEFFNSQPISEIKEEQERGRLGLKRVYYIPSKIKL